LNVTLLLDARTYVQPGESFRLEAQVGSNKRLQGVNLTIQMPRGFQSYPQGAIIVNLGVDSPITVWWNIIVPKNATARPYGVGVRVTDTSGAARGEAYSDVTVVEPRRVEVLGTKVEIPDIRVMQDRSFTLVKSVFVVVYSQKYLVSAMFLAVIGGGYAYYAHRRRRIRGGGPTPESPGEARVSSLP